jgi:hypothetical protein
MKELRNNRIVFKKLPAAFRDLTVENAVLQVSQGSL